MQLRAPVVMRLTFDVIDRTYSTNGELIDFRGFPLIRSTGEPTVSVSHVTFVG